MDFLLILGHYPAQFRHLASLLGNDPCQRVVFLTAREDEKTEALPVVEIPPSIAIAAPPPRNTITSLPRRSWLCRDKRYYSP